MVGLRLVLMVILSFLSMLWTLHQVLVLFSISLLDNRISMFASCILYFGLVANGYSPASNQRALMLMILLSINSRIQVHHTSLLGLASSDCLVNFILLFKCDTLRLQAAASFVQHSVLLLDQRHDIEKKGSLAVGKTCSEELVY